uniref:Phosphatidylcholine transfer protein n=1 Tax=Panagrolaimus superbus TaxID=310955 RepID=A0A914YSF5_9BILA
MYRRVFTYFRNFQRFQKAYSTTWYNFHKYKHLAFKLYKPPCILALTGFSMTDYGLSDDEIIKEAKTIENQDHSHKNGNGWEILVEEKELRVYRRKLPGKSELYEYKCSGSYYDITPRNFVDAQLNIEYRREWDANVLELEIISDDPENDIQVVRWVAKYPFPMNARIYIYVRKKIVDENARKIIVSSHAVDEKLLPDKSKHVRVNNYRSSMVINAHKSFDDDGLDYVLTYHDDPQANIPNTAYNWIVNRGGPYFLKQVHVAAKKLEKAQEKRLLKN